MYYWSFVSPLRFDEHPRLLKGGGGGGGGGVLPGHLPHKVTASPSFHSVPTLHPAPTRLKTFPLPAARACSSGLAFGNLAVERCIESVLLASPVTCESRSLAALQERLIGFPETRGPHPGPYLTAGDHWLTVVPVEAGLAQGHHKAPVTRNS